MRRVKSAPANLASMSNNKKEVIKYKTNHNNLPLFISSKNIESKNNINNINNIENSNLFNNVLNLNLINKEKSLLINKINSVKSSYNKYSKYSKYNKYNNFKYEKIKNIKKNVSQITNIACDLISDNNNISLEESTLINAIIIYITENVTKKDKLKQLYEYLLQFIIRYLIMLFVHGQILHDKTIILPNVINQGLLLLSSHN